MVTAEHGDTVAGLGVRQPDKCSVHVCVNVRAGCTAPPLAARLSCCLHEGGVTAVCAGALLFGDDIDVVVAGAAGTG